MSFIIDQWEEWIYLDGILYMRIRIHGRQRPESKPQDGSAFLTGRGPELHCRMGISSGGDDGELSSYFLFKLALPPQTDR